MLPSFYQVFAELRELNNVADYTNNLADYMNPWNLVTVGLNLPEISLSLYLKDRLIKFLNLATTNLVSHHPKILKTTTTRNFLHHQLKFAGPDYFSLFPAYVTN